MNYKDIIISSLTVLRDNAKNEGGIFQVRAYDKVINNIKNFPEAITNYKQIENIDGAGKKIKLKLQEIIETGHLIAADKILQKEDSDIKSQLLNIYGIGPAKAKSLIEEHKISSIYELRKKSEKDKELLTSAQKIGLLCYEDLLKRIPREEMLEHQKILNLKPKKGEIVGSFRRLEKSSGDIDVMLNMDSVEFENFTKKLIDTGYIKFVLAKGDKKMLAICQLIGKEYRRIDLIRNSPDEYPFMKMYFTGPKEFNVAFRQHCLDKGLSLNEHSFTPKVNGLKTEKDIFEHVGLKYVEPELRSAKSLYFL